MAKVPVMGRVKTRLAAEVGGVEAVRFYRHTLTAVVRRLATDRRWLTSLAIAPDIGITTRTWPRGVIKRPQGGGDLGHRMQRIMQRQPPGPVIIVGTDIPAIEPKHIAAAFKALRANAAVLGAAPDGGYWLVGLRRSPRILAPFDDVHWSSATTLSDTARNLGRHPIAHAAVLADVDSASDFAACRNRFGRSVLPAR